MPMISVPSSKRLRRRDHLEAQQLLADAEDVARLERLLLRDLEEDAIQAAEVPDRHRVWPDQ